MPGSPPPPLWSGGVTWVRLDDRFTDHPKVVGLSDKSFRNFVDGLCYAARHLTDGRIPKAALPRSKKSVEELVEARLWALDEDGSVVVHDYLEWNPSRLDVLRKRETDSVRKQNGIRAESERNPSGIATESERPVPVPIEGSNEPSAKKPRKPRERDPIWDALESVFGTVIPGTMAHKKRNVAVRDLKLSGATGDSVQTAYRKYLKLWSHVTPSDTALAKHYPQLVNGTVYALSLIHI